MWNQYESLHKYVVHDGRPVKRVTLYSILHTRKDGTAVNPEVQVKMVSNPFYYIKFYYCLLLSLYMGA